ncbi:glycoside hydrolase family 2 protein [Polycladomyces sp. WAk]|uniref:Beta-mannosidase B n=1 Tax=Polycladomyces zharkentensis TaxID=2807616 RepID=A0ABS2WIX1_9BACL|nr:glycoside hydrolase family 2 protein [Polycladomyces sp. WAk]MBN2909461.1 glycoside hydrolase family 2 protein [Polycladomyces sp. WAk]
MKINQNWKIQWFEPGQANELEVADPDYIDHFWISAKVPGDVHSTLIEKKIIDDPFVGHNDIKCRWVEEKVWWYRTEFDFDEKIKPEERLYLIFEGLDTFATIYLNGIELGSTENMFIAHTFDVTREIRGGRNVLAVKFDPVSLRVKGKRQDFWSGFSKERIWVRKAQMNFGWDWGPRLVTVGIWQDVRLEKKRFAKLESVFARTLAIGENKATVAIDVEVDDFGQNANGIGSAAFLPTSHDTFEVEVSLTCDDCRGEHEGGQNERVVQRTHLNGTSAHLILEVKEPRLWWTHDLGTPHLYRLEVTLFKDGEAIDRYEQDFGIRMLEVRRTDEKGNARFTFVLNGVELFAKGANWIPVDSFIGAAPDSRYVHLIRLAREANMNMLRVWGGGIYEKDVFYRECDRQGILVWQDFMFACALYPDFNRNFMANVREEIARVVKRLRNYACVALWCGNNENDWIYEQMKASGEITTPFYGEKIYHELIPQMLAELDPTRLYWPSSPYGGNDHNSAEEGDRHNWQVWHGKVEPRKFGEIPRVDYSVEGVSFKNFKKDTAKFVSEFGMHAAANRYTLERNIPQGKFFWGSDELAYRNKDDHHQKGILLMEGYTGVPRNLEEYLNFSMLTQGEGLKYGIEHYRRHKPSTSGALFWQLNDCWPGTSWSVIDYYLLPKAGYYYAKKCFHPVLYTLDHESGEALHVWVVNDRLEDLQDTVSLHVYDFDGKPVFSREMAVQVSANVSVRVARFTEEEMLQGHPANRVVVCLRSVRGVTPENFYYLRDQKELGLPETTLRVRVDEKRQCVTVFSERLARFVKIELPGDMLTFSDNYFDLLPGMSRTIQIDHLEGKKVAFDGLRVSALNVSRTQYEQEIG